MAGITPGWNDPPPRTFDVNNVPQPQGKRTQLNKRIGFSLSTPGSLLQNPPSQLPSVAGSLPPAPGSALPDAGAPPLLLSSLPPPPPSSVPPPPPSISRANVPTEYKEEGSSGDLNPTFDADSQAKTMAALTLCLQNASSKMENKLVEDVHRRLVVLNDMWTDGKLNQDVQTKISSLSKELESGNHEEAYRIHQNLIVNHVALVTPWMVGVKHLILHRAEESRNQLGTPAASENTYTAAAETPATSEVGDPAVEKNITEQLDEMSVGSGNHGQVTATTDAQEVQGE